MELTCLGDQQPNFAANNSNEVYRITRFLSTY